MAKVTLKPINKAIMSFRIVGTSPLLTHNWDDKVFKMMRDKQQANATTKVRAKRDPVAESEAAAYKTAKGEYGIPGMALKSAIIGAAHKDIGIEKTLVRKALFLITKDPKKVLPLVPELSSMYGDIKQPIMQEDPVRVGMGTADLRYRPLWHNWAVDVDFEVDMDLLQEDAVVALVNRAGFGVGICEWRPECNGENGRFEIDTRHPFTVQQIGKKN